MPLTHNQSPVICFSGSGRPSVETQPAETELDGFKVVNLWGYTGLATSTPRDFIGRSFDSLPSEGAWSAHLENGAGKHLFLTDPFGMDFIFYFPVWTAEGSTLLVGRNGADIAAAARILGAKLKTDWHSLLPTLAESHSMFHTCYQDAMPLKGMKLLRTNEVLIVDHSGFRTERRPRFETSSEDYGQLIEKGVDAAITQLGELKNVDGDVEIRLSGGKDSRLVLAMALEAGLHDKLVVGHSSPSKAVSDWQRGVLERDLEISSKLVSRFGLRWKETVPTSKSWPVGLKGSLNQWIRWRGGISYQYTPRNLDHRFVEHSFVLHGTGGETFRSFWKVLEQRKVWPQLKREPDSLIDDAVKLFDDLRVGLSVPREFTGGAARRFAIDFAAVAEGDGLDLAMISHYKNYRNRGHVGSILYARDRGVTNISPLMKTQFIDAMRLLAPQLAAAGQVGHDAIELLDPTLNDLEFQSGPWECKTNDRTRFDWSQYPSSQPPKTIPAQAQPVPKLPPINTKEAVSQLLTALSRDMQASGIDNSWFKKFLEYEYPDSLLRKLLIRLATWAQFVPNEFNEAYVDSCLTPEITVYRCL